MRMPLERVTIRQMMVLFTVLSVPLAFWAWRMRAGFAFPALFDLVPLGISVVTVFIGSNVLAGTAGRRARLPRLAWWGLLLLNVLIAVWFTSVEWAWIQEDCPRCGHGRSFVETRFFSSTPRCENIREYPTVIELVAMDLGIPCTHESMSRWRKQRWLGGCLPVEMHIGTFRLWDRPWYPPCARDAIRSWSAEDPNFVVTFRKRVLEVQDRNYFRTLIFRMYDACPGDQRPSNPLKRGTGQQ